MPDLEFEWRSPSTLGNGLVFDTRWPQSAPLANRIFSRDDAASGIAWSGFVGAYDSMRSVGFRPTQLEAGVIVTASGDSLFVEIYDESAYLADEDANFDFEVETYLFEDVEAERAKSSFAPENAGARPIAIDSFNVPAVFDAPTVGFSVSWVYDEQQLPWTIVLAKSEAEFENSVDALRGNGYRPISFVEETGITEPAMRQVTIADMLRMLGGFHVSPRHTRTMA